jgi:hypothetical protein
MFLIALFLFAEVVLLATVMFITITSYPLTVAAVIASCITLYCIMVHLHYQEQIATHQGVFVERKQKQTDGTIEQPSTFIQWIYERFLDFEYEYYLRRNSK